MTKRPSAPVSATRGSGTAGEDAVTLARASGASSAALLTVPLILAVAATAGWPGGGAAGFA